MGTNLKRFLIMLVTVFVLASVLVTAVFATGTEAPSVSQDPSCYDHGDVDKTGRIDVEDALVVLGHSYFPTLYPVDQDCNFDGIGGVDVEDAIYVLGYTYFPQLYPLNGTIHSYYDPVWNWGSDENGVTVSVTVKCGCEDPHTYGVQTEEVEPQTEDAQPTVKLEKLTSVAATCTAAGSETYKATITLLDGTELESEHTVALPALGHVVPEGAEPTCEEPVKCEVCGEVRKPALGHTMVSNTTPATCTEAGKIESVCSRCQADSTKKTEILPQLEHSFKFLEERQDGCIYTKYYKCEDCDTEKAGETREEHTLKTVLTQEATCVADGEKTTSCEKCGGETSTEVVLKDTNAHKWGNGVKNTEAGTIDYTCATCSATKSAPDASAAVAAEEVAQQELAVDENGTTVQLDQAAADTIQNTEGATSVKISVETTTPDALPISNEQKAQIGEDTVVYDFNMLVVNEDGNEQKISEFGENAAVTVSLPYKLEEGEDIDSINIWFVDDDGSVEPIKGTYANGFVTFTTNHFSYYTVTRLTPAERCMLYYGGHDYKETITAATCTNDGYVLVACSRCNDKQSNEVIKAKGHALVEDKEASKSATCEAPGVEVMKCTNDGCTYTETKTLFAKGHAYELDEEQSVEATCTAAGKNVYVCSHDDTHVREEKLAQLQHNYVTDEEVGTVAPTCTTSGYTQEKCSLCGDTRKVNEVPALGHNYVKDVWTWDEDTYTASVVLTCSHDLSHKLPLENVATRLDTNGCVSGGYIAETVYNNVKYYSTCTLDKPIENHTPAEEWSSNGTYHFHTCTICKLPIGNTAHTFEQTVTKEATCQETGTVQKVCTVCGYTAEELLPITGHNLVNGVCTVCDYTTITCDHIRTHREAIDLSAYAGKYCDGLKPFYDVCECGQHRGLGWYIGCDINYENQEVSEITLSNGVKTELYTNSCDVCGLQVSYADYQVYDEEACMRYNYVYEAISIDGTVVAELEYPTPMMEYEHPGDPENAQIIDLHQYGLCEGTTLELSDCFCGKAHGGYENGVCNWSPIEDDYTRLECAQCGIIRTRIDHPAQYDKDTCQAIYTSTVTYTKNGEVVYSYDNLEYWTEHEYEIESFQLDGTSCNDGILITRKCANCGEVNKYYSTYHTNVYTYETDLSANEGICADKLVKDVCACGEAVHYGFDQGCEWGIDYNEGNTTYYSCISCGAVKTESRTFGEKNEFCDCQITETETIFDAKGNQLVVNSYTSMGRYHNTEPVYELQGESCTDGVQVTWICTDCGEKTGEYVDYGHISILRNRYDLSSFDACFDAVGIYQCPCGQNTWDGWEVADGVDDEYSGCNWLWYGNGVRKCENCGLKVTETYGLGEQLNACQSSEYDSFTISKDGCRNLNFGVERINTEHKNVEFELTLMNENGTCEDGVRIREYCTACGTDETYENYGHNTYKLSREVLYDGGDLCGVPVKVTYGCACGRDNWTNFEWEGESCQNTQGYEYNEELEDWVYICNDCGRLNYCSYKTYPIEGGEPCQVHCVDEYGYFKNVEAYEKGEVLFTYTEEYEGMEHNTIYSYVYEDENNKTCAGGYRVAQNCLNCDYSFTEPMVWYDESTRTVDYDLLHDGTGLCGPIEWFKNECACGYGHWGTRQVACNFTWNDNEGYYECTECGLQEVTDSNYTPIEGQCAAMCTDMVTYTLPDGTQISRQYVSKQRNHQTETSFSLEGETCDDGYYVTETCKNCDYVSTSGLNYGHSTYRMEYVNLADYGMCGGEFSVWDCACGDNFSTQYFVNCSNYQWTDEKDEETGLQIGYCSDCGYSFVIGENTQTDAANCKRSGNYYIKIWNAEDELVLTKTVPVEYDYHTGIATDFECYGDHCNDGYKIYMKCAYCTETWTEEREPYEGDWHNGRDTQLPFSFDAYGACAGGMIRVGRCPCGEEQFVSHELGCYAGDNWEYGVAFRQEEIDGVRYDITTDKCKQCGLTRVTKTWIEDVENSCTDIQHSIYTYTREGTDLNAVFTQDTTVENHDYTSTDYQLKVDGGSCEDGVIITNTCKVCGHSYEGESTHHNMVLETVTDLKNYGAVCDSELILSSCVCGEHQRFHLNEDESTACDWDCDYDSAANWIPNVLNEVHVTSTAGDGTLYSNFYTYTCPVTNPEKCGIKLRMGEYWLEENCVATEYQTWQVYDPAAETWIDLGTVTTGERWGYHTYEITVDTQDTQADGTIIRVTRHECTNCDSYYELKQWVENGNNTKQTNEWYNANYAENGFPQSRYEEIEFGVQQTVGDQVFGRETMSYVQYVYADGSMWWERRETTYDFSGECTSTYTTTDSYGNEWGGSWDAHLENDEWITVDYKAQEYCSQPGYEINQRQCPACQAVLQEMIVNFDAGHYWDEDEDGDGIHVCGKCGLENTIGADGTIVMEDMTEVFGDGTNYVVGYHNGSDMGFESIVSVILKEADTSTTNDMIPLNDVVVQPWENDQGIVAVTFTKMSAEAAAQAAMQEAGYTGDYAIRINMVPMTELGTLDYAITFDSLVAE